MVNFKFVMVSFKTFKLTVELCWFLYFNIDLRLFVCDSLNLSESEFYWKSSQLEFCHRQTDVNLLKNPLFNDQTVNLIDLKLTTTSLNSPQLDMRLTVAWQNLHAHWWEMNDFFWKKVLWFSSVCLWINAAWLRAILQIIFCFFFDLYETLWGTSPWPKN